VTGGDRQQLGGGTEQAREPVARGEQRAGAVLAAQAQGEGVVARGKGGAVAFGGGGGVAGGGESVIGIGLVALGGFEAGFEFGVVGFEAFDLGLELLVLLLGGFGSVAGLVAGGGEPADLGLGGPGPAAGGVDLALEAGKALATVGDSPGGGLEPLLLVGEPAFQLGAVADGVVEGPLGGVEGLGEFGLLLADAGGLALHVLGVAAVPLLGGLAGGMAHPLFGEADRAVYPLLELRERVPGALGVGESRGQGPDLLLQARLALDGLGQHGLDRVAAFLQCCLVGDFGAQGLPQCDKIVSEQPQPGVTEIGLDHGCPPGHLGLPSERFELPPELTGEVLYSREIYLHRVEFPQRFLLALAVLQHARSLFDEGPAPHRIGVQYGVELALTDDHMHLTADAGVGQEFLDVQETAGVAVELVLTAAVAEHDPRDGDLGILDGQHAVAVVDRQ
jgi:hypothetical protein